MSTWKAEAAATQACPRQDSHHVVNIITPRHVTQIVREDTGKQAWGDMSAVEAEGLRTCHPQSKASSIVMWLHTTAKEVVSGQRAIKRWKRTSQSDQHALTPARQLLWKGAIDKPNCFTRLTLCLQAIRWST